MEPNQMEAHSHQMEPQKTARIDLAALLKTGTAVGVILYTLCVLWYWIVLGAEGAWMMRPFMPGLSTSVLGLLAGLGWSILYAAGIPWLYGWFYNYWAR